jgi:hypothetical protein
MPTISGDLKAFLDSARRGNAKAAEVCDRRAQRLALAVFADARELTPAVFSGLREFICLAESQPLVARRLWQGLFDKK